MSHDEICYYYNISSILINTGLAAGLPNVIVEAVASKLPIIAIDVGATKDVVNEEKGTGILIKNYDSQSIESAILKILNKEFSGNFDRTLLEKFSFTGFGQELIKIYKKEKARFQKILSIKIVFKINYLEVFKKQKLNQLNFLTYHEKNGLKYNFRK